MALPRASEHAAELRPAEAALPSRHQFGSLKTRLRLSIIFLVTLIVLGLSILHLERVARITFEDVHDRASLVAEEAKNLIIHRVTEVTTERIHSPRDLEHTKNIWSQIIREDPAIASMLVKTMAASKLVVEIRIRDQGGLTLASSSSDRIGELAPPLPVLPRWSDATWSQRWKLLMTRQDYMYAVRLGQLAADAETLFTVEAVVSSILIWDTLLRDQIAQVAVFNVVALALALFASMLFADIALRPVESISLAVDRIAKGEMPALAPALRFRSTELADVHSKLNLLGQKFRGARQDAMELRTNIEQMLDRLKDAVLFFDSDLRLVMASKSAEVLFAADVGGVTGRPIDDFFPQSSKAGQMIRHALETGEPVRERLVTLGDSEKLSGALRVYLNVEMLQIGPDRHATLIVMRDAETRMEIQSQLDISTRLAAISRLTSGVAHEIKNPLNAMTLHLELLRSRIDGLDPGIEETLGVIRREVSRLDRVVKTFLDFTRPVEPQMRPIDMAALVRQASDLLRLDAEKRGFAVMFRAEPGAICICGDPDLLNQAILNIMVNGLESMHRGGVLDVQVGEKNGDCIVTIADQGAGISPEIRDKIFNLYFTTKGTGSGIGLAIAFQVVQLHNGTIDFSSTPGQGTTFRLQFPVYDQERSADVS